MQHHQQPLTDGERRHSRHHSKACFTLIVGAYLPRSIEAAESCGQKKKNRQKKHCKNLQRWCYWAHGSCCEANKEFMTSCFTLDAVADGSEIFFLSAFLEFSDTSSVQPRSECRRHSFKVVGKCSKTLMSFEITCYGTGTVMKPWRDLNV